MATPREPDQDTVEYSVESGRVEPAATIETVSPDQPVTPQFDRAAPGETRFGGSENLAFTLDGGVPAVEIEVKKTVVVPGYEILGELGRGGMGVVYKARQRGLNRIVALKMLLAGSHAGDDHLARFHAEAEAVARLQHEHIVQIYEVGQADGLAYFSLEFVDGASLAQKLAGKPQPPREAARLVETLAKAMQYAHDNAIVHRDLKPANVLLTVAGVPKITDFGLAKRLEGDSSQTKSGTIMGTPSYMAPEQARGDIRSVGPPADLYALGAILYETLTGRPPFLAANVMDTVMQVLKEEPVPPSRLQPKLPRDLETICLKCLQKEPNARYLSAAELAADLGRFTAGEPILARPVRAPERLWRWCRRNPRVAALSGAVAVLLTVTAVALGSSGLRMAREREAVAKTRELTRGRLDEAIAAIEGGDSQRALDLLSWRDPSLDDRPSLADLKGELSALDSQVRAYSDFKRLLDRVRYAGLFSTRGSPAETKSLCGDALSLYADLENKSGNAPHGLPPLSATQEQLFKEDVFEAHLIAAQVEVDLAATGDEGQRTAALKQAVAWLDRAEKILPPTRILFQRRNDYRTRLGETGPAAADADRANQVPPTSAVDRFWQGFDRHRQGDAAAAQGDAKLAQEHYRQAIAEQAALLRIRPDHFWGYFGWASCLVRLGDQASLSSALVGFTACVHVKPDIPWPYYNRGTVHFNLKQYAESVADFDAAVALDADYAEAYLNRALAQRALGKEDLALADFDRALEANPNYSLALFHRGETHRLAGRLDEAIGDYDQAIALNPRHLDSLFNRAVCRFSLQQHALAADGFSAAIELAPNRIDALKYRGFANLLAKRFDASLADWQRLVELQPVNAESHYYIGAIQMGQRDFEAALAEFETALTLKPDYHQPRLAKAQILHWQGRGDEALAEIDGVLAQNPPEPAGVLNDRADVLRTLGRLDEAAAEYRRSVDLSPTELDAYVGLALVALARSKPDEAAAVYDELIAAVPESAVALIRRTAFHRNLGRFAEARADCDEAATRSADPKVVALVRASIQAAEGRHAEAASEAERILAETSTSDGHALYAATLVFSLAAKAAVGQDLAATYADRAATLLAQTLDLGFHDLNYQEHNALAVDPALDPIRSHPRAAPFFATAENHSPSP